MNGRGSSPGLASKRRATGDIFEQYLSISRELDDALRARRRPLDEFRERVRAGEQAHRSLYQPLGAALRLAWGCAKAESALAADAYLAHDDAGLIAADYMTARHGGILIYDAVEPFELKHKTAGYGVEIPRDASTYYSLLSRPAMLQAQTRFATSQPLGDFLQRNYNVPFVSLPNYLDIPATARPASRLRDECGCSSRDFLILYVNSIYPASHFDEVLAALSLCDTDCHLVNFGDIRPQSLKNEIDGLVAQLGLASRVHFLPALAYERYIEEISGCDAAIVWLDPNNVNCITNLHNRYLDAIAAGLPLLSSRNEAFAELNEEYRLGLIELDRDPAVLARRIATLRDRREAFLPGLARARSALRWENVEERFAKAMTGCRSVTFITRKDPRQNGRIRRQIRSLQKLGIRVSGIGLPTNHSGKPDDIGTWFGIPDDFEPGDGDMPHRPAPHC